MASISADGMPHRPKPPDMMVMPSRSKPAERRLRIGIDLVHRHLASSLTRNCHRGMMEAMRRSGAVSAKATGAVSRAARSAGVSGRPRRSSARISAARPGLARRIWPTRRAGASARERIHLPGFEEQQSSTAWSSARSSAPAATLPCEADFDRSRCHPIVPPNRRRSNTSRELPKRAAEMKRGSPRLVGDLAILDE